MPQGTFRGYRRNAKERRADDQTADLAQVCIIYCRTFGYCAGMRLFCYWGIPITIAQRVLIGRYRGS